MRDPTVALYVLGGLAMLVSAWRLSRVLGPVGALAASGAQLVVLACATIAMPTFAWWFPLRPQHWMLVAGVIAAVIGIAIVAAWPSRPADRAIAWLRSRPLAGRLLLAVTAVVLSLGALEFLASSAVRAGLVQRYTPTETVVAEETEDWRLAHVMSDEYREPDRVLLWRPVASAPYTSQRFRGPEVAIEKPPGVTRIICYGDSNTDGPLEGGAWPEALGDLLAAEEGTGFEVLNAGVTGYSSYQGRLRFEQELDTYAPDVVLLSFGWNDAANAIGGEDKVFAASSAFRAVDVDFVRVRRWLLQYDTVLVVARLITRPIVVPQGVAAAPYGPRVALADYETNLRTVVDDARATGARVVLMTRPHLQTEAELASAPGWRSRVPDYNRTVRRLASESTVPLIDAQKLFEPTPDLFVDAAHLTREGHSRLADEVARALRTADIIP